jgi:hypothetical protein
MPSCQQQDENQKQHDKNKHAFPQPPKAAKQEKTRSLSWVLLVQT